MLLVRITGAQLRAARALAGLTIEDVAARAQLCRHSIRKWEGSSNAVPDAMVGHLSRAIAVLEHEGVRFTDGGIWLERLRTFQLPISCSLVVACWAYNGAAAATTVASSILFMAISWPAAVAA
jgi:transcriptional regulator with XRE-family HTH domain